MSAVVRSPGGSPRSLDAIVVLPGIMGSELVDAEGRTLWGLEPRAMVSAFAGGLLDRLVVTDDDLEGRRGVTATRLLRYPAALGWFRGSEDYHRLLRRARTTALDERAVTPFPFDWRLAVDHNGRLLARRAAEHWERWRSIVATERLADPERVGLTLLAHSMGGLVARAAQVEGLPEVPTRIVTLGTPFYGSVKAIRLLADGSGAPVPGLKTSKLQAFAVSSPGLHDLLPRYRCVTDAEATRRFTPEDLATLGGDARMGREAQARWDALDLPSGPGPVAWHSAVGTNQPTLQSVTLGGDGPTYHQQLLGTDETGDGTVYRRAAGPGWPGYSASPHSQTHAALISGDQSDTFVRDKLLDRDEAPPLGVSFVSAEFPEYATAGRRVQLRAARFLDTSDGPEVAGSGGLSVRSTDLSTNQSTTWTPVGVRTDGWLTAAHPGLRPGLHRVAVSGGGDHPIMDLLWVGQE